MIGAGVSPRLPLRYAIQQFFPEYITRWLPVSYHGAVDFSLSEV